MSDFGADFLEALRAWDRLELANGAPAILDYQAGASDVAAASGRWEVRVALTSLLDRAPDDDARARVLAHLTYLDATCGQRLPLGAYVARTQGLRVAAVHEEVLEQRHSELTELCCRDGLEPGEQLLDELVEVEGSIALEDLSAFLLAEVAQWKPVLFEQLGRELSWDLRIEVVEIDDYWSYWVDGVGRAFRLRINRRNALFTPTLARQFAAHELLGHVAQLAAYFEQYSRGNLQEWEIASAVHGRHQTLLEGLAQALPHYLPGMVDHRLAVRIALAHLTQLVRNQLHIGIERSESIDSLVASARHWAPWLSEDAILRELSDRSSNPLLRSYLYAYPAGMDLFVRAAETTPDAGLAAILQRCYATPLAVPDVEDLLGRTWPPAI